MSQAPPSEAATAAPLAWGQACQIILVEKLPKTQCAEIECEDEFNSPLAKGWLLAVRPVPAT
jgi:hypothetical protein